MKVNDKIKHIKGDIFETDATFIIHQVNCRGVMGSGVAKQVKEKYPEVFEWYKTWCDDKHLQPGLLGKIQVVYVNNDSNAIINLFAQEDFGTDGKCYTNYSALKVCLTKVNEFCKNETIAIPYKMSCHRGGGDWDMVYKIIQDTLVDCDVTIYEYQGR